MDKEVCGGEEGPAPPLKMYKLHLLISKDNLWEFVLFFTVWTPRLLRSSGLTTGTFTSQPTNPSLALSKTGLREETESPSHGKFRQPPWVSSTTDPKEHFFYPELCFPRFCFLWEHPGPDSCQRPTALRLPLLLGGLGASDL